MRTPAEWEAWEAKVAELRRRRAQQEADEAFVWGPVEAHAPLPPWALARVQLEVGGYVYRAELPVRGGHVAFEQAAAPEPLRKWRLGVLEQILAHKGEIRKEEATMARYWTSMSWQKVYQGLWHLVGNHTPRTPEHRRRAVILAYLLLRSPEPTPAHLANSWKDNQQLRYVKHPEVVGLVDPVTGDRPRCPSFVRREVWAGHYDTPIPTSVDHNNMRIPVHADFARFVDAYDPRKEGIVKVLKKRGRPRKVR